MKNWSSAIYHLQQNYQQCEYKYKIRTIKITQTREITLMQADGRHRRWTGTKSSSKIAEERRRDLQKEIERKKHYYIYLEWRKRRLRRRKSSEEAVENCRETAINGGSEASLKRFGSDRLSIESLNLIFCSPSLSLCLRES